ncbi:hypothetical protein PHACT_00720 [Pseudohongiella acticola]|uniref:Uncharacterized protein n=1 Tax=Pseudohongiella acticola TaxID=1524254 RepID=A0A1E8CHJ8_9GAMM|nr:hypothetical protein [Pseudohongiella acticola]OFE11848.1 hypothetical protein PHACT_00720 [Pseudohongiella acticola]
MTFTDKRKRSREPAIEPDLLDQGIAQLKMEIQILSDWLRNLDNSEAEQQISYKDMLQSRKEMLRALEMQKAELTPPSKQTPTA